MLVSVIVHFAVKVEGAVDALSSNPQKVVDENEFIDASRLVYDGVRDIRRAVLLNKVGTCLHHREIIRTVQACSTPFMIDARYW